MIYRKKLFIEKKIVFFAVKIIELHIEYTWRHI